MQKYYVDSCVWIDLFENRTDRFRPLGEWALCFLKKINSEENTLVISDVLKDELESHRYSQQFGEALASLTEVTLLEVSSNRAQFLRAKELSAKKCIPLGDALHAIIAKDEGAILVSRDRHFQEINFVECKKPEDLL